MSAKENIPVLLNYGGASKSSFEMSEKEFKDASLAIKNRAKEKAFSKGLPVYSSRGEDIVAEYPDGSIVVISIK